MFGAGQLPRLCIDRAGTLYSTVWSELDDARGPISRAVRIQVATSCIGTDELSVMGNLRELDLPYVLSGAGRRAPRASVVHRCTLRF